MYPSTATFYTLFHNDDVLSKSPLYFIKTSRAPRKFVHGYQDTCKLEKLLLQNDNGARKSTTLEKIFFFSIEKQKEWEKMEGQFGRFVRLIPCKHFSRKNIGYLFAILHGAQYIFDFDDDNFIKLDKDGKPIQILPNGNDPTGIILENVNIIMQGGNVFNHHPIMGASLDDSWARGFPIEMILNKNTRGQVAYEDD